MVQLYPQILDLVFVAFAAAFASSIGWILFSVIRSRPLQTPLWTLLVVVAIYGASLAAGSLLTRDRYVPLGTTMCFDDWCANVTGVHRSGTALVADVRVSSIAQRVTQSASNPRFYFIDERGMWYAATVRDSHPSLKTPVAPGESFDTRVAADVPAGAAIVAVRVWEGGWIDHLVPFDEQAPLHGKTYYTIRA